MFNRPMSWKWSFFRSSAILSTYAYLSTQTCSCQDKEGTNKIPFSSFLNKASFIHTSTTSISNSDWTRHTSSGRTSKADKTVEFIGSHVLFSFQQKILAPTLKHSQVWVSINVLSWLVATCPELWVVTKKTMNFCVHQTFVDTNYLTTILLTYPSALLFSCSL